MKDKLEKLGLLNKAIYHIHIPSDAFLGYLAEMVGSKEEVKLSGKPKFPYYGHVKNRTFEIKENISYWTDGRDAKLTGSVTDFKNKIEIRVESMLLAQREYVFIISSILMLLIVGFNLLIYKAASTADYVLLALGLSGLVFTYGSIKVDSEEALKRFGFTIDKIKKRYHTTVQP